MYSVSQIAEMVQGKIIGDSTVYINKMSPLESALDGAISFCAQSKFLSQLKTCEASAVLVKDCDAHLVNTTSIIVPDPYLAFAMLTKWFDWRKPPVSGIASSAYIGQAKVSPSSQVCKGVCIGDHSFVGENCYIGANTVIGDNCTIANGTRIEANVTLYDGVTVGEQCLIHSGAVIGADGFGFAKKEHGWQKIHQLGSVIIGDDVEIGAGTTIDRGALTDTIIGNGVKIDNQVQIAHNVQLGDYTAIAGCTAIAGSAKIGKNCTIAGLVGITGHLEVAEGSHVTAMSLVSHSLKETGVYSSGTSIDKHQNWKKNVVRFKSLDALAKRVKKIDNAVEVLLSIEDKSKT
jgi:UDP-3-O-[3-hydroxymyristoyl] glucosamine N-acyltransferase